MILLVLNMTSCSNFKNDLSIPLDYSFDFYDSLVIDLNSEGYSSSQYSYGKFQGQDILITNNHAFNSFSIYDLSNGNEIEVINLDKDDYQSKIPRGNGITGIYYHNEDSLFLMSYTYRLVLINLQKGAIQDIYNLNGESKGVNNNRVKIDNKYPFAFDGKYVLTTKIDDFYFQKKVFSVFDIEKKVSTDFFDFPKMYEDKDQYLTGSWYQYINHYYDKKSGDLIFGFPIDHQLYRLNLASLKIETNANIHAKPFHQGHYYYVEDEGTMSEEDFYQSLKNIYNQYHYTNLMYDEKNKFYLRLIKHPTKSHIYDQTPTPQKYRSSDHSLVIYNDLLEIIGQALLPKHYFQIGLFEHSDIFFSNGLLYVRLVPLSDEKIIYYRYEILKN